MKKLPKRIKHYRLDEVIIHNLPDDMWVLIHGNIFDLTRLMSDLKDTQDLTLKLLQLVAGLDLSDYFEVDGSPKMKKNSEEPILPVVYTVASDENRTPGCYWWEDPLYFIGKLTSRERKIRILNTLTRTVVKLKLCEEDTFEDIKLKYFDYNRNERNYIWRKFGEKNTELQMDKTLTQNGILYEENEKLGLPHAIWLYYTNPL